MKTQSAWWHARGLLVGMVIVSGVLPGLGFQTRQLPVPSSEAQNEVMELIREVFKKEYEGAKTAGQKTVLAGDLLKRGVQSKDDTERFVLLRVARDIAALAGDAGLACEAINEMARHYAVDSIAMKKEALGKAAARASVARHYKAVAEQAAIAMDDAVARDDYDAAKELAEMARTAARKAQDSSLVDDVEARAKKLDRIAESAEEVKLALAALEKNPGDPKANLAVGIYHCLLKGDWDKGLPMLALAGDDTYSALAKKELVGATSGQQQVELADAWWELGEKSEPDRQRQLRGRAVHWYEQAVSQLSGLTKLRVEKRLSEIAAAEKPAEDRRDRDKPEKPATVVRRKKASFEGTWRDCFNSTIEFKVEDRKAVGTYKNMYKSPYSDFEYVQYEGRIVGKVSRDGKKLTGQWARSPTYSPPADAGALIFTLNREGTAFGGTFTCPAAIKPAPWTGIRIK